MNKNKKEKNYVNKKEGTLTGKDDESTWTYTGGVLNGKMHGKRKCTWSDGDVYKGDYVNGMPNGKGKSLNSDGTVDYEGIWVNKTEENGSPFVGSFVKRGSLFLEDSGWNKENFSNYQNFIRRNIQNIGKKRKY
jgi:hypothetical protein